MTAAAHLPLALRLLLTGTRLIEASAGTGKTHTLVLLLLRAIIALGIEPRALLAVTFTRAAAGELRERTRAALAAAARRAADPAAPVPEHLAAALDALIAEALRDSGDPSARATLARRLRAAEMDIDALWLTTMHGFCQRLLAELGPMLGEPGEIAEVDAGDDLFVLACADAWRALQAREDVPDLVAAALRTPDDLVATLRDIVALPAQALLPMPPDAAAQEAAQRNYRSAWATARAAADDYPTLAALIADRVRFGISKAQDGGLSDGMLDELRELLPAFFAQAPGSAELPEKLCRLAASSLDELQGKTHKKRGAALPAHPLPAALDALLAAETAWRQGSRIALLHALHADVRARMDRLGFAQGRARYDDLIARTASLLAGPAAARLKALAQARWRLALIDEFQDTDAEQHAIFAGLFGDRLILVGDPKQAIYRFRGGDVHAYRRAAEQADGRERLGECFRAEPAMVAAVNALFDPQRIERPFREHFIDYQPVACAYDSARHGRLASNDGASAAGLRIWPVPAPTGSAWANKTDARRDVIASVADAIAQILDGIVIAPSSVAEDSRPRAVAPRDIAVLCTTNDECAAVAAELRRRGVPVSLGADPQIEAAAAEDIRRLLAAWLAPQEAGRLRALALSGLYGRILAQLPDDGADSPLTPAQLSAFAEQARLAQDGEIGRALLDAVRAGAAVARARPDGRQRIEAWLRLVDRLAGWSAPGVGLHEIHLRYRRWLAGQTNDEARAPPEDADAVRVMTIHLSKGLEFGIVFAPFLWDQRDPGYSLRRLRMPVVRFHDGEGRLRVDLGGPDFETHVRSACEEDLAESMRRTYVAITRARHLCLLPVAVTRGGWSDSPLARLLPGVDAGRGDGLDEALAALARSAAGSIRIENPLPSGEGARRAGEGPVGARVEQLAGHSDAVLRPDPHPQPLSRWERGFELVETTARRLSRPLPDDFRLLSYSRLVRGLAEQPQDHDQVVATEIVTELSDESGEAAEGLWRPRGAAFGSCFHAAMETIEPSAPDVAALARIAGSHGFGGARDRAYLERLVRDTLAAELPGAATLAALAADARAVELEFFLPVRDFEPAALGRALAGDDRYRRPPGRWASLHATALGYLRGFIDLVYRAGEQYFVLDYKTNDLGDGASSYADAALAEAIRGHDYDLQYLIYLVALQRLLRSRLGDRYDYERHVGGAVYLFVRGLRFGAGIHHDRPPAVLIDALERVFCGDAS